MQHRLKDADSAKFRDVRVLAKTLKDGSVAFDVCGEVNAKNSYGAYGGYSVFLGMMFEKPADHWVGLTIGIDSDDSHAAEKICKDHGLG